jgi:aminoglycoside/choline kinase family phosphotransferase
MSAAQGLFDGMDLEPSLHAVWGEVPTDLDVLKLKGDASTRSYYRVTSATSVPASLIVMRLPGDALKSDELSGADMPAELPFLNVQRHLRQRGIAVPEVLVSDLARGVVLLEDLGDETFEARLLSSPREAWLGLYRNAIDLMVQLHRNAADSSPECIAYGRTFDRALLRWELEHFREWGLDALSVALSPADQSLFAQKCDALVEEILALPQGFVHRDFQSRNLMWSPKHKGSAALVVIDFQDALMGPAVYDLVALLCDSYVDLTEAEQRELVAYAAQQRGESAESLERAFWLVAVQRKLKDAGRFVFIDQVRGNPGFLPWYAPSLRYVGRALGRLSHFSHLGDLLTRVVAGFPDRVGRPEARTGSRVSP